MDPLLSLLGTLVSIISVMLQMRPKRKVRQEFEYERETSHIVSIRGVISWRKTSRVKSRRTHSDH